MYMYGDETLHELKGKEDNLGDLQSCNAENKYSYCSLPEGPQRQISSCCTHL